MNKWTRSADGLMKKAKSAITQAMPANKMMVNNETNPASALNMMKRKAASAKAPGKAEMKSWK